MELAFRASSSSDKVRGRHFPHSLSNRWSMALLQLSFREIFGYSSMGTEGFPFEGLTVKEVVDTFTFKGSNAFDTLATILESSLTVFRTSSRSPEISTSYSPSLTRREKAELETLTISFVNYRHTNTSIVKSFLEFTLKN